MEGRSLADLHRKLRHASRLSVSAHPVMIGGNRPPRLSRERQRNCATGHLPLRLRRRTNSFSWCGVIEWHHCGRLMTARLGVAPRGRNTDGLRMRNSPFVGMVQAISRGGPLQD